MASDIKVFLNQLTQERAAYLNNKATCTGSVFYADLSIFTLQCTLM